MTLRSINPATGATNGHYSEMNGEEVAAILARADHAFRQWRRRSIPERAEPMRAAGRLLRERARQYARLMAEEMGKPVTEGIAECEKCATTWRAATAANCRTSASASSSTSRAS